MIFSTIVSTLLALALSLLLFAKGKKERKGWTFICFGVGTVFIGHLLVSLSLFFPAFNTYVFFNWIFTNSTSLLALFVATGLCLIGVGIYLLNLKIERDQIQILNLEKLNSELEKVVKKTTSEHELTVIEADQFFSHLSSQNEALNESAIVSRVDLKGKIIYVNELFCKITEYSLNDLIGEDHSLLNSGYHSVAFWADLWSSISQNKRWRGEIRNRAKSGTIFWVDTVIVPIKNDKGKTMEYLAVRFDITERKKAERDLAKAKNAAEEATKAKSEFLARMSHEIRTPMNAIIGLSQLALKTKLNSQQQDYISKVNLSGKSLLGIINDILDFSKIEAGKLVLERVEFDLEKVFQDLENMLAIKAFDKGLEFVIRIAPNVPLSLIGDPLRLGQILINLVNNAIKFTKDGEVTIYAFLKKKTKKNVTLGFRISDTGIGIEKSKVEDLFRSFSQADNSTTRQYGGTGLGLAISKKLAKSMHGNIEVQSTMGIGSEFTFNATFGISKKQKRERFVLPKNIQELNVFVCDNNITAQAAYKDILESFRCKVRLFSNGYDLLEAVENGEPCNLAIIDWYMPDMDGVQTAQKIHESSKIKTFPHIIICTKPNNESLIELVNKFGINAFLNKPINSTSLFNIILKIYERTDLVIPSTTIDSLSDEEQIAQINGASILLVEDNEVNQQVAKEILESVGCKVDIATNGLEAVQKTTNSPLEYELILMDIQMPVMDGFIASAKIRENPALKSIPIVAITADAIVGIKEKCIQVGMNDMITKPFEPNQIYTILLKYIQIKERKKVDVVRRVNNKDEIQLPVFNYIDTHEGLRRVNKNRELYVKLIRNFYKNYYGIINQVIEAYFSNDQLLAKRLIHTLKGISGNLGAKTVYTICLELELREGLKKEQLISLLEPLKNELMHVFNEIATFNQLMEKKENQEPITNFVQVNKHELIRILLILKNQLENSDADSIETIKNLLNQTGVSMYRSTTLKIENELNQYNFDEALKLVDNFIETLNNR